jgi:glycosyltransferase involved in cell wall biosynthesis
MPAWKLFLKRLEITLSTSRVDGLIFQAQAMAQLAIYGRGVPERMVDVVPQGVDVNLYTPEPSDYVYRALSFPSSRRVIVYAGHMERRKGPHVLVEAAIELLARRRREDVCFLLCGNKEGESLEYERAYEGMGIDSFIKFGGYRSDLKEIYQSCFCGVVPSSGWDSFPRTSLELAACGLPVIVSRIGGLPEAIVEGKTGLLFDPGNVKQLADRIETLLDNPKLAKEYGEKGRERCVSDLNLANQLNRLMIAIRRHIH